MEEFSMIEHVILYVYDGQSVMWKRESFHSRDYAQMMRILKDNGATVLYAHRRDVDYC